MRQPKVKQRAVRLTAEALDMLNESVNEKWRLNRAKGKLTRQVRADLFEVSLPTHDKILNREKVDRSSLTAAFKAVGIPWNNRFIESEDEPLHAVASDNVVPAGRKWRTPALVASTVVLASLAVNAVVHGPQRDWTKDYDRELRLATNLFSKGAYADSEAHLAKAMELAETKKTTRDLEAALKLRGDIAASRGRLPAASEYYKATIRYRELRRKPIWPSIHEVLGGLQIRIGDFDEARKNLDIAEAGFKKGNEPNGFVEVLRDRGCLAAAMNKPDEALEWFAKAQQLLSSGNAPDLLIDVRGERAMTLMNFGRLDEAHQELEACLRHWSQGDHERWIGLTEMRMGLVEAKQGHKHAAVERLASAKANLAIAGDEARLKEVGALLARLSKSD